MASRTKTTRKPSRRAPRGGPRTFTLAEVAAAVGGIVSGRPEPPPHGRELPRRSGTDRPVLGRRRAPGRGGENEPGGGPARPVRGVGGREGSGHRGLSRALTRSLARDPLSSRAPPTRDRGGSKSAPDGPDRKGRVGRARGDGGGRGPRRAADPRLRGRLRGRGSGDRRGHRSPRQRRRRRAVRRSERGASSTPASSSARTGSATCGTGRRIGRSPRSGSSGSATTSRWEPTRRSTAPLSGRRSSAAGRRSTTSCRSGTTWSSASTRSSAGRPASRGSARLEDRVVTLAGQAGVNDHVTIGTGRDRDRTGRGHAARSVPAGAVVSGMPALPHREFLRSAALARAGCRSSRAGSTRSRSASPRSREGRLLVEIGIDRDPEDPPAPVSVPARGPDPGDRGGQADRRHQERHLQRGVLPGALPRQPGDARRPRRRGDGPGRR